MAEPTIPAPRHGQRAARAPQDRTTLGSSTVAAAPRWLPLRLVELAGRLWRALPANHEWALAVDNPRELQEITELVAVHRCSGCPSFGLRRDASGRTWLRITSPAGDPASDECGYAPHGAGQQQQQQQGAQHQQQSGGAASAAMRAGPSVASHLLAEAAAGAGAAEAAAAQVAWEEALAGDDTEGEYESGECDAPTPPMGSGPHIVRAHIDLEADFAATFGSKAELLEGGETPMEVPSNSDEDIADDLFDIVDVDDVTFVTIGHASSTCGMPIQAGRDAYGGIRSPVHTPPAAELAQEPAAADAAAGAAAAPAEAVTEAEALEAEAAGAGELGLADEVLAIALRATLATPAPKQVKFATKNEQVKLATESERCGTKQELKTELKADVEAEDEFKGVAAHEIKAELKAEDTSKGEAEYDIQTRLEKLNQRRKDKAEAAPPLVAEVWAEDTVADPAISASGAIGSGEPPPAGDQGGRARRDVPPQKTPGQQAGDRTGATGAAFDHDEGLRRQAAPAGAAPGGGARAVLGAPGGPPAARVRRARGHRPCAGPQPRAHRGFPDRSPGRLRGTRPPPWARRSPRTQRARGARGAHRVRQRAPLAGGANALAPPQARGARTGSGTAGPAAADAGGPARPRLQQVPEAGLTESEGESLGGGGRR